MAAQSAFSAARLPDTPPSDLTVVECDGNSEQLLPVGIALGDGGRYVIEEIVAIGGMATVYRAADTRLSMAACAVKAQFLSPAVSAVGNGASDEDARAFREEARLLAGLRHPGIVAVRDYFEERTSHGAFAFIVQEFVDGQNLYDRHRRLPRFGEDPDNLAISPVPEDQVALYGLALARALDYLHTRPSAILYRDLKPHNIVRRASDGQLVLLDFGISRRVTGRAKRCYSDDLGTPGYAAPEQYERFGVLDARTDIYSLGVVLAELATGYNPRAENAPRHMPRLDTLPGRLSPMLRAILQKCVEAHPAARYASATELVEALDGWRRTPRRLRHLHEPTVAWQIASEELVRRAASGKPMPLQIVTIGDAGEAFALSLPGGGIRIVESACGQTLAERTGIDSQRSGSQFRLSAGGGGYLAQVADDTASGAAGASGSTLEVFDGGLKLSWRLRVETGQLAAAWLSSPGADSGSRIAVASRQSQSEKGDLLVCAHFDSKRRQWSCVWQAPLAAQPKLLASAQGGGVLALDAAATLSRFSLEGAAVWQREIVFLRGTAGATHIVSPAHRLDLVLVCGGTTVEAVHLETGASLWRAAWVGFATGAPQVTSDGSRILLPTRECGLVELDANTGRTNPPSAFFPRPVAGLTRLVNDADMFAVAECGAGARVALYDASSAKLVWKADLPELGASGAPCVSDEADIIAVRDLAGGATAWRWSSLL